MNYKIVIVTSGQPSLNPRMVKEADSLVEAGCQVTVLYAYWNRWGADFDKQLILSKKWDAICIGGDPNKKKLTYVLSRLIHKFAKAINRRTGGKYFSELAITRAAFFLKRAAKKHQADLYIAHNLGALPAVAKAAKKNKKLFGFDAEDFHRFEESDSISNPDVILKSRIEDYYIPQLDYFSTSSPLIAKAYKQLFPDKNPLVILNVFPGKLATQPANLKRKQPLRLFWFSQTIGPNRGIEDIIDALSLLKGLNLELHLLGNMSPEMAEILEGAKSCEIYVHKPLPPDEIIGFASRFDIGLAAENSVPSNRDICLTNKIFTYIQAGIAVVASDTSAQRELLEEYPAIGKIYKKRNAKSLADILYNFHQNREQLIEAQRAALQLSEQKLNWENEQTKFLSLVQQTIEDKIE